MSEECQKAKLRALRILTRMDKTEADLRAGLERAGFSAEAVQEALEYVKSYGYINDRKYAEKYVEYNKLRKSRKQIRYKLIQKGVDRDYIEQALEACEDFDELALIRTVLYKKWKKDVKPDEKELSRLYAGLLRRGFARHDIWKVLHEENLT